MQVGRGKTTPLGLVISPDPSGVLSTVQCKIKSRALVDSSFSPYFPTMPANYTLYGREPDAGSGKFSFVVQSLERVKQFICEFHVKTGAIVFYNVDGVAVLLFATKMDMGVGGFAGKFPGVADNYRCLL